MTAMVDFTVALLRALPEFLMAEPIIYLFAIVLMCFLVKFIRLFF